MEIGEKKQIWPAPGKQIRDPKRKDFLPPEGRVVVVTTYWHRRLVHGDVVDVAPPATVAEAAPDAVPSDEAGTKNGKKKSKAASE